MKISIQQYPPINGNALYVIYAAKIIVDRIYAHHEIYKTKDNFKKPTIDKNSLRNSLFVITDYK